MPRFDPTLGRIVVRVVYDGPAGAGKTEFLRALWAAFGERIRGELIEHADEDGSTRLFDWFTLDSGLICGRGLRTEVVTVPGGEEHRAVRSHLLETADSVVWVVRATEQGLDAACALGQEGLPCLLLATGLDRPHALSSETIRTRLELDDRVPIVPSFTDRGVVNRDGLLIALRRAADLAEIAVGEGGEDAIEGRAADPAGLEKTLRVMAEDSVWRRALEAASELGSDTPPIPVSAVMDRIDLDSLLGSERSVAKTWDVPSLVPPRPLASVPAGAVWPSVRGREVLAQLQELKLTRRADLESLPGDPAGSAGTLVYQTGGWCLKTSTRRRYETEGDGRARMNSLVRWKLRLGDLMQPNTVISLQPGDGEEHWLWTASPWALTLRSWMEKASRVADAPSLVRALNSFSVAALRSAKLAAESAVVLEVDPSNFAVEDGHLRYVDDDFVCGGELPALGEALVRCADEFALVGGVAKEFARSLQESLGGGLSRDEARRIGLLPSLEMVAPQTEAGRAVRDGLLDAARRLGWVPGVGGGR